MKKVISICVFVLITLLSFAQSQGELNDDAQKQFEKANKELNQVYSDILKEYKKDTVFIKN